MDLYVVNKSQPNTLYLNKGTGTFEDVTAVAGLNPAGKQVMGKDGSRISWWDHRWRDQAARPRTS